MKKNQQWQLADASATATLGAALAKSLSCTLAAVPDLLSSEMVIYLEGNLGTGKTTLVRSMLSALGHVGPVKSPTYAVVEVYQLAHLYCHHFDFYRFNTPEEFLDAGLEAYFCRNALCLVEWPEKAGVYLPPPDWRVHFDFAFPTDEGRIVELQVCTERGKTCLSYLNPT